MSDPSAPSPPFNADGLFDPERGYIAARAYHDQAIYERELANIFEKCWLFLGHESQIPKPGDFFASYMGEDPIVVARQRDGSIKAFLNQCRHRGARLCKGDRGNAKSFTCSYHGWSYDISGDLIAVPFEVQLCKAPIDKSEWGAVKVPRLHNYHGLLFGTWDADGPSFEEYAGDFLFYLDANFARAKNGTEVVGGVHRWIVPTNWKFAAEQFASDIYHFNVTHASAMMGLIPDDAPPQAAEGGGALSQGRQVRSALGHGGAFATDVEFALGFTRMTMGNAVADYYAGKAMAEATERLGKFRGSEMLGVHMTFFPTMSYLPQNSTLRVWHPRGPNQMEVWQWVLVDRDSPPEVKDAYRIGNQIAFGSSGIFEQDDSENWVEIARTLRGRKARQTQFNMQIGLREELDPEGRFPGTTDVITSESAARAFYARWFELISQTVAGEAR